MKQHHILLTQWKSYFVKWYDERHIRFQGGQSNFQKNSRTIQEHFKNKILVFKDTNIFKQLQQNQFTDFINQNIIIHETLNKIKD